MDYIIEVKNLGKKYARVNIKYIIVFLLFLISVSFAVFKYKALLMDHIDFSYYLQFSARAFDVSSSKFNLLQIGHNMFGLLGIDGGLGLHRAIHFEPIKYLFGLIYFIFGSPIAIFVFYSLFCFFPAIYLLKISNKFLSDNKSFLVKMSFLYCLFPSMFALASFDLRPYAFLLPASVLLFLSIQLNRPKWEIFLFFNILFLIREEALYIGLLFVFLYFISHNYTIERKRVTRYLFLNWLFWFFLIVNYIIWTGYQFRSNLLDKIISLIPILFIILIIGLSALFLLIKKAIKVNFNIIIKLAIYLFMSAPFLLAFMSRYVHGDAILLSLIYEARWSILFLIFIMLTFLVWDKLVVSEGGGQRKYYLRWI